MAVNNRAWSIPPPPQATTQQPPSLPEKQVAEIFDFMVRLTLSDLDLEIETKDLDTEYLKYFINLNWNIEKARKTHDTLLQYLKLPHGFTWDAAGDALFNACIYYSDLFVDAPFVQAVARRAEVKIEKPFE